MGNKENINLRDLCKLQTVFSWTLNAQDATKSQQFSLMLKLLLFAPLVAVFYANQLVEKLISPKVALSERGTKYHIFLYKCSSFERKKKLVKKNFKTSKKKKKKKKK